MRGEESRSGADTPTGAEAIGQAEEAVVRKVLMDVRFPEILEIEHVEIRRITIAPDTPAGLHIHNGPVLGGVLRGSVTFQIEGEGESVLEPGDAFYEPEGTRIARFDAGRAGASFLACYLLSAGEEPRLEFPAQ